MRTICAFTSVLIVIGLSCSSCSDNVTLISSQYLRILEPNRESIVYVSTQTQRGFEIYLTHHGETSHLLTWGSFNLAPDWSPDKKWIVYTRGLGTPNLQIWKMRYDGSQKRRLTKEEHHSQSPRWSPDGRYIAFTRTDIDRSDIFVMDTSGSSVTQITTAKNVPFWSKVEFGLSHWSSDGTKIICTMSSIGNLDDKTSLAIISLDTVAFAVLNSLDSLHPSNPRWSPTRNEIVFVGRAPTPTKGPQIYRSDTDGRNVRQLTDAFLAREPDWSWDGERIIYTRLEKSIQDNPELWMMNRDGTNHRKLLGDADNAFVLGNW